MISRFARACRLRSCTPERAGAAGRTCRHAVRVVSVEAPDALHRGHAGRVGFAQAANQLLIQRTSLEGGAVRRVHHQLLPQRQAVLVGPRKLMRLGQQFAVALADTHAFEGQQGFGQKPAQLRDDSGDLGPFADGEDHHRHIGVAAEDTSSEPAALTGAVHAEHCTRARDAATVQEVAEGDKSRGAADALLAAHVDRQFGRLAWLLSWLGLTDLAGQQPCPLERDQPLALDLHHRLEDRLDPAPFVDGDRHQRKVLGQGQQAVGVETVEPPEAPDPTQQHAGLQAVGAVDAHQLVAHQPVPGAVALPEVGRQLQAVLVHWYVPILARPIIVHAPAGRRSVLRAERHRTFTSGSRDLPQGSGASARRLPSFVVMASSTRASPAAERAQLVAGVATIALGIAVIAAVPQLRHCVTLVANGQFTALRAYIQSLGAGGVALLLGLMVLHAIIFYPSEIVTTTAGYVYGFWPGLALAVGGWFVAALLSYALGRAVGGPVLRRLLGRRFEWLTTTMQRGGTSLLLSSRLIPIVPFALVGYAAGATQISLWRFSWTTVVGYLPLTIAVTYLGSQAQTLSTGNPLLWIAVAVLVSLVIGEQLLRRRRPARTQRRHGRDRRDPEAGRPLTEPEADG